MEENKLNNKVSDAKLGNTTYGEEEMGINDYMIYQGEEGICAIRSQQIILRDYGVDISIEELKQFAIQNGWYDPSEDGGTPMWAIGALLESCNVPCRQEMNCTIYDLVNELAQGHRVIVGVDANELWASRENDTFGEVTEWFTDFFDGETPNHALIVAGVEVNPDDPEDVKVILTDPGTGDLRIEYDLDDFMDAWEDSQCFMTTTTVPAPLQYDPVSGREVPSNFAMENYINFNSIPLNPDNVILPGEMAAMCADPYYKEGHLNQIPIGEEEVEFDKYEECLAEAQKYKSTLGGNALSLGQGFFDMDGFIDGLKHLLGIDDPIDPSDLLNMPEPDPNPKPEPPIPGPEPDPEPNDDPFDDEDDLDDGFMFDNGIH